MSRTFCTIVRLLGPAIMVIAAIAAAGCSSSAAPSDLRPEIATFLQASSQYGTATSTEAVPDWAEGARQRVRTSTGTYLFYMKSGEVVTVYKDDTAGRTVVWRKPGY